MALFLQILSLSFNSCAPFPASPFSHEDACDFPIFLDVENPPIVHWFPFFLHLWIWEQTNLLYFHSRDSVGVLIEVPRWLTTDSASANHFPSREAGKSWHSKPHFFSECSKTSQEYSFKDGFRDCHDHSRLTRSSRGNSRGEQMWRGSMKVFGCKFWVWVNKLDIPYIAYQWVIFQNGQLIFTIQKNATSATNTVYFFV